MTTTVLIGTQGNKAVRIKGPNGEVELQPGAWLTLGIHGEQSLLIHETGDFLSLPPNMRAIQPEAAAPVEP